MSDVSKRERDFSNPMFEAMRNMESQAEAEASRGNINISSIDLDSNSVRVFGFNSRRY